MLMDFLGSGPGDNIGKGNLGPDDDYGYDEDVDVSSDDSSDN